MVGAILKSGAGTVGVPAPYFFSRGDAAKRLLTKYVEWWHRRYPTEYKRYRHEVRYRRETLLKDNGMSRDGDFAVVALIPTRVNIMLEKLMPGFWANGGKELWINEFSDFRVKKK